MKWQQLYAQASTHLNTAAGYYNHNVRVDTPDGPVNVRIPIDGAEVMDLRIWDEASLVPAVTAYYDHAPRLLYASSDPRFQVHDFIRGNVLNDVAPRGVAIPRYVLGDIATLLGRLTEIPREKLPALPPGWPAGTDTKGFGRRLSDLTSRVHKRCLDEYARHYAAFGVPEDPLAPVLDAWTSLAERPLVLVHADIHRKNIIIKDAESYFLDWELALWGDPVYDLAVHLHKMGYLPEEADKFMSLWAAELPEPYRVAWQHDLDVYLAHEQIKSVIVDVVRYSQLFEHPERAPEPEPELTSKLTDKLNNAYARWEISHRIERDTVEGLLREVTNRL